MLEDAVVRINAAGDPQPVGTGFIFWKDDHGAFILTCRHVMSAVRSRIASHADGGVEISTGASGHKAEVVFESTGDASGDIADLAVLRCAAVELRERTPLRLSWPISPGQASIISFRKVVDASRGPLLEKAQRASYQLGADVQTTFQLRNDTTYHIGPNHSGSPVLGTGDVVIGIVAKVVTDARSTTGMSDDLIVVISIDQLVAQWHDAPPDLMTRIVPGTARRNAPIRAKILVLMPCDVGHASDEFAVTVETVSRRVPQGSDVEIWYGETPQSITCARINGDAPGARPRPQLAEFDVLVRLLSHDSDAGASAPEAMNAPARRLDYRVPGQGGESADDGFAELFERDFEWLLDGFATLSTPGIKPQNPYKGLERYDAADAALFNGRARETGRLCAMLAATTHGALVISGASGSGKSSVARAGLLHRLELDGIPESSRWPLLEIQPSQSQAPLRTVAAQLHAGVLQGYSDGGDAEIERALTAREGVAKILNEALQTLPTGARLVFFIDQFEELFTQVRNENRRDEFLSFLRDAVALPRVHAIVTMRGDFYPQFRDHRLAPSPSDQQLFWLQPLGEKALVAATYWPAAVSGFCFEDTALLVTILRDAGTSAGTLPLLSYALKLIADKALETHARSAPGDDYVMRWSSYREIGGVRGVIDKQVDEALRVLSPTGDQLPSKETIGRLFHRLVTITGDGTAMKKAAVFDVNDSSWTPEAIRLARVFVDKRLLLLVTNAATSRTTIEIAHEALLSNWVDLTDWIGECRGALLLRQKVERSAADWDAARRAASDDEVKKHAADVRLLWPQEELDAVTSALRLLQVPPQELSAAAQAFMRPEFDRIVDELTLSSLEHARRYQIGDRLEQLGDRRTGVGLDESDLPQIEWCAVPAGAAAITDLGGRTLGSFDVKAFYIARYPITLRQFKVFAQPRVYFDKRWWAELPIDPEQHRPHPQSSIENCPAQFVSWFQAMAFCAWLSEQLGYAVRLPRESEWVQAFTGGNSGYLFPWGPGWDPARANHREVPNNRLVSVGMYPNGRSSGGAYDLSGNMYEWCLNEFDHLDRDAPSVEPRTTRGGAYFTPPPLIDVRDQLSVHHRLRENPDGTRERGQRIGVCMRLAAENPR